MKAVMLGLALGLVMSCGKKEEIEDRKPAAPASE
ncbi:uncharacterized protein METZ01_LOCUS488643, partial [marine metagenome]